MRPGGCEGAGEHIKRNRWYRHHGASVTIFGVLDNAQNQVFSITGHD